MEPSGRGKGGVWGGRNRTLRSVRWLETEQSGEMAGFGASTLKGVIAV